jgi:hypothetical protein
VLRAVYEALLLAKYYVVAMIALNKLIELTDDMPELQAEAREAAENLLWVIKAS